MSEHGRLLTLWDGRGAVVSEMHSCIAGCHCGRVVVEGLLEPMHAQWLDAGGDECRLCGPRVSSLYVRAQRRVGKSPRLRRLASTLLSEPALSDDDHLRWVIRGRVGEIEACAAD